MRSKQKSEFQLGHNILKCPIFAIKSLYREMSTQKAEKKTFA